MKGNIHPEYYPEAQVICSCGNTWNVGATVPTIRTDVCSKCHPFFTGQMRIVDSGGRVERFMKKLEQRDQAIADAEAERKRAMSPALPISELGVGSRTVAVLSGAGVVTVGDLLAKLEEGEEVVFSWVIWPDKATCEAAHNSMMSEEFAAEMDKDMPFDGKRMIYGGFEPLVVYGRD